MRDAVPQVEVSLWGPIFDFLQINYTNQLGPIIIAPDEHLYFDLHFDLLEFIYDFPSVGPHFFEYP